MSKGSRLVLSTMVIVGIKRVDSIAAPQNLMVQGTENSVTFPTFLSRVD